MVGLCVVQAFCHEVPFMEFMKKQESLLFVYEVVVDPDFSRRYESGVDLVVSARYPVNVEDAPYKIAVDYISFHFVVGVFRQKFLSDLRENRLSV